MSNVHCRLCGKHVSEIAKNGSYLARVNPKGEPFIGECRPSCDHKTIVLRPQDEALIRALTDKKH